MEAKRQLCLCHHDLATQHTQPVWLPQLNGRRALVMLPMCTPTGLPRHIYSARLHF